MRMEHLQQRECCHQLPAVLPGLLLIPSKTKSFPMPKEEDICKNHTS